MQHCSDSKTHKQRMPVNLVCVLYKNYKPTDVSKDDVRKYDIASEKKISSPKIFYYDGIFGCVYVPDEKASTNCPNVLEMHSYCTLNAPLSSTLGRFALVCTITFSSELLQLWEYLYYAIWKKSREIQKWTTINLALNAHTNQYLAVRLQTNHYFC
jgi:hypothetical protein